MVQIPEFTVKTAPTSQTGTRARPVPDITSAAAAPFEAAAELAGDVQKISTRFYEAQKSLQRKTEASKLIDLYLKGDKNTSGLNELSFNAQNNPNTNTALQDFQNGHTSLVSALSANAKDPVVKQIFEAKTNEIYNNEYLNVQSSVWKNIREDGIKTLNKNIEYETNKIIHAGGNTALENSSWMNIETLIKDGNSDGLGLPNDFYNTIKDQVHLLKAEKLITDNHDLFLKNLESGYYNDKISPDNLLTLRDRALGKKDAAAKSAVADIKTLLTTTKSELKDLTDPLKEGDMINTSMVYDAITKAEQLSSIAEAAGLGNLKQEIFELDAFYKNAGLIDSYKNYTRNDLIDAIEIERENLNQLDDPIRVAVKENLLKNMNTILDSMNEELDDNMLGYYQKIEENMAVPELDLTQELSIEDYYSRYQIAHKARNKLDPRLDVQYFTKNEKIIIKSILEGNDRDKISSVLQNIYKVARNDAGQVLKRLNIDNPGMSHLSMMLFGGETETTMAILDGHIASKDKANIDSYNVFKEDRGFEDKDRLNILNTIISPDFKNQFPQTSTNITAAADLIFMDMFMKNKNDITNGSRSEIRDAYSKAVQMASGLEFREGVPFGGFVQFQEDNYILLPGNMPNGDFSDALPSLKETFEDKLTLELLNKAVDGKLPVDPDGNEIPIESFLNEDGGLKDVFHFETIDRGKYYITKGNPKYFNVTYYKDERGKPIIFNLGAIAVDLMQGAKIVRKEDLPDIEKNVP